MTLLIFIEPEPHRRFLDRHGNCGIATLLIQPDRAYEDKRLLRGKDPQNYCRCTNLRSSKKASGCYRCQRCFHRETVGHHVSKNLIYKIKYHPPIPPSLPPSRPPAITGHLFWTPVVHPHPSKWRSGYPLQCV